MKHGNLAVFVPHVGCPHRCSFCDQRAISGVVELPTAETVRDLCARACSSTSDRLLELAFFGGSFTAIERGYLLSLLGAAQPFLGKRISGIRISTRPDAVEAEMLSLLRENGVTSIELGAQSMLDRILVQNGRGHTAQDVREGAARILSFGFELGLQMMLFLDGAREEDDLLTARELIACHPQTVRLYPTLVLRGSELEARTKQGVYLPATLEEGVQRTARVMELFGECPDIRIIRVGLHPAASLEQSVIAGPYHPAFRELCEGEIMLGRLLCILPKTDLEGKTVTVAVRKGELSRMLGQNRRNARTLEQRGLRLSVSECEEHLPLSPEIVSLIG